ncbi:MAG: UDP-N-acetylenolpyruvoylglucosamine reductase [Ignavibacteria bacterium RBG_16_34_14]|nr:MAG: UDP-N-acetylenolpyruvoylglucosamine reductase [Ignavibacteria bacterium RBG_16_34_14]
MNVRKNISLKPFNTFGIDVKAKFFSEVRSELQLKKILSSHEFNSVPKLIIGGGSNILLTKDFDGLVLKVSIPDIEIISEDDKIVVIKAGAGVIWHDLILYCLERNFGGIENLSLIPGTVGAAPIQNIGAYGQELKDVFKNLDGIFLNNSNVAKFSNKECKFGYRDSIFKNKLKDKFIVTYVTISLSKNPVINLEYGNLKSEIERMRFNNIGIKEVSEVVCRVRLSKLPDPAKIGNAGSFFKNPEISEERFLQLKEKYNDIVGFNLGNSKIKVPAGWLIENCGWKGKVVGNTGTHTKQAVVLVNYGNASGKEIMNLAKEIKESVFQKFGIELNEEVNII